MTNSLVCQCGRQVPFAEEDRGGEIYCPSCGRAAEVPLAAPLISNFKSEISNLQSENSPAAATQARTSVFSSAAVEAVSERVAGRVPCLCGESVPFQVSDFGGSVYCPKCGAAIQVGESLPGGVSRQAKAVESTPSLPVPPPRRPSFRSLLGVGLLLLLAASGGMAGYVNWNQGSPAPLRPDLVTEKAIAALQHDRDPFHALTLAQGWQRRLREHSATNDDPRLAQLADVSLRLLSGRRERMLELINALETAENPGQALVNAQAWTTLLRNASLADDDERLSRLAGLANGLLERADPITLAMIDRLPQRPDGPAALLQAQTWQEALRERDVPATDARRSRLTEVAVELLRRLSPAPRSPSDEVVQEFRRRVQALAERLHAGNLDAAQVALVAIEELLDRHADELSSLTARYLALKAHLRQAELLANSLAEIRATLDKAERAVAAGDGENLTSAVEFTAHAKFLARRASMRPEDADKFQRRAADLAARLRLARGRRAAADARRCHATGDMAARDRAVRLALTLLPGLPESQIRPHVQAIAAWRPKDERGSFHSARPSVVTLSPLGHELARRDLFEQAWEAYGGGDGESLARACAEFGRSFTDDNDQWESRLAQLAQRFFDTIEALLADAKEIRQLAAVRRALAEVPRWRELPRWKTLDGALRQRGAANGEHVDHLGTATSDFERDLRLLGQRQRMLTVEDLIEVRRLALLLLAVEPEHAEARRLLEQAKENGAQRAAALLQQARRYRGLKPELYRAKLAEAIRCDPFGPDGRQARELLDL